MIKNQNNSPIHGNITCNKPVQTWYTQVHTVMYHIYNCILVHTGTYWYIPVCTKNPDFVPLVGIPDVGIGPVMTGPHPTVSVTGGGGYGDCRGQLDSDAASPGPPLTLTLAELFPSCCLGLLPSL